MTREEVEKYLGKKVKITAKINKNEFVFEGRLSFDVIYQKYRLVSVGEPIIMLNLTNLKQIEELKK